MKRMMILAVLLLIAKWCKAVDYNYSTNQIGANADLGIIYGGTNSIDSTTNRDNYITMINKINHNSARLQQMLFDAATNANTLSNRVNTISNTVASYAVRPYYTNVTLVAATSLKIYFPAFSNLTTNYVVTAPNDLVGATTTDKQSNNFTLGFTAITITAQTVEGALIAK